ncbi:hypothetical protein N9Z02_02705 [Akkermansiaceae bacterium]|nr:hypothetical protein [Akkermansiaceae bacterium]
MKLLIKILAVSASSIVLLGLSSCCDQPSVDVAPAYQVPAK